MNVNELEKAVKELWDANYTSNISAQKRTELVTEKLQSLGVDFLAPPARFQHMKIRHPMTRKKDYGRSSNALDVLADFIMRADQVAERFQDYPISNADAEFRHKEKRKVTESVLVLDEDKPDNGGDWPSDFPIGGVLEHSFNKFGVVEDILFKESKAETVEELRDLISEVKANADEYVKRYANSGQAWNDKQSVKMRTPENVRKAIKALDVERVRSCRVCGQAFYAHDLRNVICDIQPYPKYPKLSCCQMQNIKKSQEYQGIAGDLNNFNAI